MHLTAKKDMQNCPPIPHSEESSWKLSFKVSKLNDKKMVCANSLNVKRHRAKKVHSYKSGSGTDVIMGLDEFSKPDRKLNHSLWGKERI